VVKTYGEENYFSADQLYHVAKVPTEKIYLIDDEKYTSILANLKKQWLSSLSSVLGLLKSLPNHNCHLLLNKQR